MSLISRFSVLAQVFRDTSKVNHIEHLALAAVVYQHRYRRTCALCVFNTRVEVLICLCVHIDDMDKENNK